MQWKDGCRAWVPMMDLKESYSVELAEYVTLKQINERLVKKKTHKYGIEVPRTVEDAYRLDQKNMKSYWRDTIKKEMKM